MRSIKVILGGIVLILSSLFCMGIVIVNHGGGTDGLALGLFISGIIICVIGLFFVRDYDMYNDDDEDEDDDTDDDFEEQPPQ